MAKKKEVIAVTALILDRRGMILLQKRKDDLFLSADEKWEFPGGGVAKKESLEEALLRECDEEIGCKVKILGKVPLIWKNVWEDKFGRRVNVQVHCFVCRIAGGKPISANKEVGDIKWFLKKEVRNLETLPGICEFVSCI